LTVNVGWLGILASYQPILQMFSTAGLRLWNELPPGLRRPGLSFDSFRRSLKTHLFGD